MAVGKRTFRNVVLSHVFFEIFMFSLSKTYLYEIVDHPFYGVGVSALIFKACAQCKS